MSDRPSAQLDLRPATPDDAGLLRRWRNDPTTRAASRHTGEISPEEHVLWLERVLDDPDRHLLIAELDSKPAGQVRFDSLGSGDYKISVSIDPAVRGAGLSVELVRAGLDWLWRRAADASRVIAEVRRGNDRSIRTFEAAGFLPSAPDSGEFVLLEVSGPPS
jgi:RimJ/RimL family protein N-acetyltransferase